MEIIGKMLVHVIKQNLNDGALLTSIQFAHNGDDWSYNFSLQNEYTGGAWEHDNEFMFSAIEDGLSGFNLDADGVTFLTFSQTLKSGAVIQQSSKLELEAGEIRIADVVQDPSEDGDDESAAAEIAAEEILNKMREIFGFKFDPPVEKREEPVKPNKDRGPCKCGCCCKKKRA